MKLIVINLTRRISVFLVNFEFFSNNKKDDLIIKNTKPLWMILDKICGERKLDPFLYL